MGALIVVPSLVLAAEFGGSADAQQGGLTRGRWNSGAGPVPALWVDIRGGIAAPSLVLAPGIGGRADAWLGGLTWGRWGRDGPGVEGVDIRGGFWAP